MEVVITEEVELRGRLGTLGTLGRYVGRLKGYHQFISVGLELLTSNCSGCIHNVAVVAEVVKEVAREVGKRGYGK